MNTTNTSTVAGSLTRHTLTAGGVAGIVNAQDDLLKLVSLLVTIIGLVWSIWEKVRRTPGQNSGPGAALLLLLPLPLFIVSGCASFSTNQRDLNYDQTGTPIREISTKAKAHTLFSGRSDLAKWKASQTDRTQGAEVGGLSQQGATNVPGTIGSLTELLREINALKK